MQVWRWRGREEEGREEKRERREEEGGVWEGD
jgi:hypothetical protein